MNTRSLFSSFLIVVFTLVLATGIANGESLISQLMSEPLGTAFTYQGRLTLRGAPVNGVCDFQFSLWDSSTEGIQIGAILPKPDVSISKGVFVVELDFGPSAFDGQKRWLQTDVLCPGDVSYTTIGRQEITATPYALYSLNSDKLDGHHADEFQPVSNVLSISAADFHPWGSGDCSYLNVGHTISSSNCGYFFSGLQLPNGAIVNRMSFYWRDGSAADGMARIVRNNMNYSSVDETTVWTNGDSNIPTSSSEEASLVIDNSIHSYYIVIYLPDTDISVYGVSFEYSFP